MLALKRQYDYVMQQLTSLTLELQRRRNNSVTTSSSIIKDEIWKILLDKKLDLKLI